MKSAHSLADCCFIPEGNGTVQTSNHPGYKINILNSGTCYTFRMDRFHIKSSIGLYSFEVTCLQKHWYFLWMCFVETVWDPLRHVHCRSESHVQTRRSVVSLSLARRHEGSYKTGNIISIHHLSSCLFICLSCNARLYDAISLISLTRPFCRRLLLV